MTRLPEVRIARIDRLPHRIEDDCLTEAENERAQRFRFPADAAKWRAGRSWVRRQLAARLGTPPHSITIDTEPLGRPVIRNVPAGFDANWSHSGPWMALVVSNGGRPGIDIEQRRANLHYREMASTVCTRRELAALAATPDDRSARLLFLQLWTAKEALMKSTGLGATLDPANIDVALQAGQPVAYHSHPQWHLESLKCGLWVAAWAWQPPEPAPSR